jgi:hypothetical protein
VTCAGDCSVLCPSLTCIVHCPDGAAPKSCPGGGLACGAC